MTFERGLCPRNRSWGEAGRNAPEARDDRRKGGKAPLRAEGEGVRAMAKGMGMRKEKKKPKQKKK